MSVASCPAIQVARARLERGQSVVAVTAVAATWAPPSSLWNRLTDEERARAERFYFARDRGIYVAAHALLACLLEATLGANGPAWRFTAQPGMKPRLQVADDRPIYANISHTSGAVAVALGSEAEVGVDIEAMRTMPDRFALAARVMTRRELAALQQAADPDSLFLRLWVRKEALIKALGLGLSAPLTDIDVLDRGEPRLPSALAQSAHVADLPWNATHVMAVAALAPRLDVQLVEVDLENLAG